MKNLFYLLVVAGVILWMAPAASAQSEEQSLGDVARKNKGDKKKTGKIVVTEDDIPASDNAPSSSSASSSSSAAAPEQSAATPEAAPAAPATQAKPAAPGSPEEEKAKQQLERAKKEESGMQDYIAELEQKLAEATTDSQRRTLEAMLENSRKNLDARKGRREEAEKAVSKKPAAEGEATTPQ